MRPRPKLSARDIGLKLKALRKERKLSMTALAARAGVSISLVSKIEVGKVSPTVMSLQKLLTALNVDLFEFFLHRSEPSLAEQIVFRRSAMVTTEDGERQWTYAFPRHPEIRMELTDETYQPHTRIVEKESHPGDICGFVLAGALTIELESGAVYRVRKGDAFYIRAGLPHIARNDGREILRVAAVQRR